MTHYFCYTGFKKIDNNICPPPPANTYIRNTIPKELIIDEDGKTWRFTGDRYNYWPIYILDN
jgi:hypothetical protein